MQNDTHRKRINNPRSAGWLMLFLVAILWTTPAHAVVPESWRTWLSDNYQIDLNGFLEVRTGWRLQNDPNQDDASINEMRLQLDFNRDLDWGILKLKGDLVSDLVDEETRAELREFNLLFSPLEMMDVKIGRQVITWGTGDLLFINDLFPKDWESFFIGRDDEYLKAPSCAIKASLFFDFLDLDLVYVPLFNNSEYIDGSRISYWNSMLGRTAGQDFVFADEERDNYGSDFEFAARLAKTINGAEVALYSYYGFWKTPEGVIPAISRLFYPRLAVYGASLRAPLLGGIGNLEFGYYDSLEDHGGADPFIRNSEWRFLTGFEHELARDFTGSIQYYVEYMQDYRAYKQTAGPLAKDEFRHLLTLRLTKMLLNQNLRVSLFVYYSPSDKDSYLRPKVHYKINDSLAVDAGFNLFFGSDDHTFFGQFEDNTNIYTGLRWSF